MIHLLIVDDEQTTREGLLNYMGWNDLGIDMVKTAEDGLDALQLCGSFKPDIVITDVKMPRMDGIQFAMKLKDMLPYCKILFLSSYAEKEYLKSAIHLKALDFIEKPVNLEVIRDQVHNAVVMCLEERKIRQAEQSIRNENKLLQQEQLALYWITRYADYSNETRAEMETAFFPPGSAFVTAIIKIHSLTESDLQNLLLHKNDLLEKMGLRFAAFSLESLRGFKDNQHLIVHTYSRNLKNPEELVNPLALFRSDLQALLRAPLLCFIGIGQLVYSPERLLDSYHTAAVAIQRQFYNDYNQIIVFREAKHSRTEQNSREAAASLTFAACLEEEKQAEAFAVLTNTAASLRENEDTLVNDAKNVFFDLLLTIFRIADKKKLQLADSGEDKEYLWSVLFRFNTMREMVFYTEEKLNQFFTQSREKPDSGSIAARIFDFVHMHYKDPDMSIKSIAEHLFLSPNYLSLQFKKETNMTINQYITDYRMEKAKELLTNKHYKLYEVATQVGFQDANYFTKIFKKVTGKTPSEFKEKPI